MGETIPVSSFERAGFTLLFLSHRSLLCINSSFNPEIPKFAGISVSLHILTVVTMKKMLYVM
jgi:hypothetical protein